MMTKTVQIFSSVEKLSSFFVKRISENILKTPHNQFFSIALSGGSTPRAIFKSIVKNYKNKIDWSKVIIFWGDERCVPPSSDESNYKMAYENLLKYIKIPDTNIFRIEAEKDPSLEAKRYSEIVNKLLPRKNNIPQFDLVMLGLGEDGHTASIFPDNIGLFNSEKLFEVSRHPVIKQKRITATGRLINNAKQVFFLVTGESKADKAVQIIEKKNGWQYLPASFVQPKDGELVWMLDYPAAQKLKNEINFEN